MMKRLTYTFAIVVILLVFGALCATAQTAVSRTTPIRVGETAPDFALADQNGNTVKLSDARGKAPVVLVFYRGYW